MALDFASVAVAFDSSLAAANHNLNFAQQPSFDHASTSGLLLNVLPYVEVALLAALFAVGAPVNLYGLQRWRQFGRRELSATRARQTATGFRHLAQQLAISDFIVFFVYIPTQICWLLNQHWRGGVALCKLSQAVAVLAFHSTSNLISCISIEIALVQRRQQMSLNTFVYTSMVAWLSALILSAPELYFWELEVVAEAAPRARYPLMQQCRTSGEKVRRHRQLFAAYRFCHLATFFWIPLVLILLVILSIKRSANSRNSSQSHSLLSSSVDCAADVPVVPKDSVSMMSFKRASNYLSSLRRKQFSKRSTGSASSFSLLSRHRRTATKTALLMALTYCVAWLPANLLAFGAAPTPLWLLLRHLVVLNNVTDPFLYGLLRMPRLKQRMSIRRPRTVRLKSAEKALPEIVLIRESFAAKL